MTNHKRGPWSQSEDYHLMSLVQHNGALNWVRIAQYLGTRTPKQCRERYHQNLKPSLNHEPITPEEGVQIERMVMEMGKRWAEIARRLHNRSDNAVKNWWNGSQNRRKRTDRRKANYLGPHHNGHQENEEFQRYHRHHNPEGPAPAIFDQGYPPGQHGHHAHFDPYHSVNYHHCEARPEPGSYRGSTAQLPEHHHHHHHHYHHTSTFAIPRTLPPPLPLTRPVPRELSPTSDHRTVETPLPSPSAVSPGAESVDLAPSLMSDSGSWYSSSPRDSNKDLSSPVDLPALKTFTNQLPPWKGFGESSPETRLPSFSSLVTPGGCGQHRQEAASHYNRNDEYRHSSLPADSHTAPNSPIDNNPPALPSPSHSRTPSAATATGISTAKHDETEAVASGVNRMTISKLLS